MSSPFIVLDFFYSVLVCKLHHKSFEPLHLCNLAARPAIQPGIAIGTGRSGMVRAIISLGAPLEVALPGLVGLVAGQFGTVASIALLGSAPLLILLLTIGQYRKQVVR